MPIDVNTIGRVALAHHWLVTMRGGERVLEALSELFPSADVFTLVCDRSKLSGALRERRIHSSMLQRLPRAPRWYPYYLPLFPFATGRMDLRDYDLIVSSDAATMKGVRGGVATHICYCHTPMRYIWQSYATYHRAAGVLGGQALRGIRSRLQRWDYEAAQSVTHFVANSRTVQHRIREYYGRDSRVIYPPVDTDRFRIAALDEALDGESFLTVSHLVPYKRVDLLVDAFTRCGRRLTILGDGPERSLLERRAGPGIRFLGEQPDHVVVKAMQRCRAFVFAGEEDFGIAMAEAQACGKPVIALGQGGATEIVAPDVTGILFEEQSVGSVVDALDRFDRKTFDPSLIRESALRFGRERFHREFTEFVEETLGHKVSSASSVS
jgi:glycosyltransferase involved in cell wall biosynthesis